MSQPSSKSRSKRTRVWIRGVGYTLVVAMGLLLWARLKLVTETPRMVYADPESREQAAEPNRQPDAQPMPEPSQGGAAVDTDR